MHAYSHLIPESLVGSIHQLNRAYLHTARDLLRCGQETVVEALFGLDETLARWLVDATPEAIERLATTPGTVLRCRRQAVAQPVVEAREPNIHTIIAAHDLGRALAGTENSLDMTRCWVIARDLHIGTAKLLGCRACEVHYLAAEQSRFDRSCPICSLYRNYYDAPTLAGEKAGHDVPDPLRLLSALKFGRWIGALASG